MERRLAAIMATDVVGYSRLIRADEEGTIAALKALRADLIDPKIAEHHGRIVKLMGDGMLAEFASVVDAVRAAVETQVAVAEHNSGLPEDKCIEFRVGINLGDVVIDGDDIHGDGVNVAARLEGLSEPGGICISGKVYEEVRDRTDLAFEDLGEQEVKNIDRSVRVWRWITDAGVMASVSAKTDESLPLPDKPSIAVLAFDNMSCDPEQEYFSDGITEDIIAALSHLPWFFVIARNSSFAFKGRAIDVKQLAQELGVQYVLEGSVRKSGNRVRITAQLIDARHDRHIWADRYDRDLTDVFAVQDEITEKIVGAVAPEFMAAEMHRARYKEAQNLDAWDLLMQAHWHFNLFNKKSNREAQVLLEKVIALDPNNDLALSDLAASHTFGLMWNWYDAPAEALEAARDAAQKAVAINDRNVPALLALGHVDLASGKFDDAVGKARKALALAPNSPEAHGFLGYFLMRSGEWEEAMEELETAIRLGPRNPSNAIWYSCMSAALFQEHRYEESIKWCEDAIKDLPNALPAVHRPMAASYAMLGRMDEARAAMEHLKARVPGVSAETTRSQFPFKNTADTSHYVDALRKAESTE
jgi:adenylate cyclase